MKNLISTLILAFLFCQFADAQRIKYKDLYPLLSVQKYDEAEPFLKEFVKDEKNRDKDPNSLLQMGLIFSNKAKLSDVLKETEQYQYYADSAILYYQLALKFIDDKEIRRNDEYYQAYKRRDIRTGEFGIKLTDIHFDLEEKIKELNKRKKNVNALADYFYRAKNSYDSANQLYLNIKADYPTYKRLLLRFDNAMTAKLEKLRAEYQHAVENFESYKNILKDLPGSSYNQRMVIKEITDYENNGSSDSDFFNSNVELWDYSKWADVTIEKFQTEILPLFDNLIAFDKSLNDLDAKLKQDSVSVVDKIPNVGSQIMFTQLKNYDPDPMPLVVFNYKAEKLTYNSLLMSYRKNRDSTDLLYQMGELKSQVAALDKMDSLINHLVEIDIAKESKNYAAFVRAQFNDGNELLAFIQKEKNYVELEKENKEANLANFIERSRWVMTDNDSIPLFNPESPGTARYLPLVIDSLVTAGLYFSGEAPAQGYLSNVTPSRKANIMVNFDVNTDFFNRANYEELQSESLVLIGGGESIYFVVLYAPVPEEDGFIATVVRVNDKGLKWANEITLASKPGQLAYNIQTDEIIINYKLPEMQGVGGQLVGNKLTLSKKGEIVE